MRSKVKISEAQRLPATLTVEEAAAVLGLARRNAYQQVHAGTIPSLRLGRRIVVPTARLLDMLGIDVDGDGETETQDKTEAR